MTLFSLSELKEYFNNLLEKNTYWSQFAGSQAVSMLSTFCGQFVYRCQQFAASALGEGFISTATKRSSILAAGDDRGYVITLASPSTGSAIITNTTNSEIVVPHYTSFISDDQYPYITDDVVTIPANGTATISVSQLELATVTTTVSAATEFYEVLLSRSLTAVCHKIEVLVTAENKTTTWTKSTMFRLATSSSKVYVMFYKPTDQIGVRFGDGLIGMIPPAGSTITLKVWCTSGDITLISGQALTPSDDSASLADSITVKTSTSITGGKDAESTEETRNRAQYYLAYDNQVVWGEDYTYYLKQNIPSSTWLAAWGEETQEKLMGASSLDYVNRIYISGWYPGKTQAEFQSLVETALAAVPNGMNRRYVYVEVNEKPFTLALTGTISASSTVATVTETLSTALTTRFGKDSTYFDPNNTGKYELIKIKDIWAYIEGLSLFSDFDFDVEAMQQSNGCNDFVFLDVKTSTFNITYEA